MTEQEQLEAQQWFGSIREVEVAPDADDRVTESMLLDDEKLLKVTDSYQQVRMLSAVGFVRA